MGQKIWRWTKRGMIAAGIVLAILSFAFISLVVLQRHHLAQFNRTYERPLQVDPDDPVLESAHRLLGDLRPSSSDNSLRFAVMPSFGKRWFAVSLVETRGKGIGQTVIVRPDGSLISRQSFEMPLSDLKQFFEIWDEISDGYSGEGRSLTDGTPLAFERKRGRQFTSGVGNSPCHYDVLGDWAAQRLSPWVSELSDLRDPILPQMLKTETCNRSMFSLR